MIDKKKQRNVETVVKSDKGPSKDIKDINSKDIISPMDRRHAK